MHANTAIVRMLCGAALFAGVVSAASSMPLVNGGFNSGLGSWDESSDVLDYNSDEFYAIDSGSLVYLGNNDPTGAVIKQKLSFQAGYKYSFSYFLRRPAGDTSATPANAPQVAVSLGDGDPNGSLISLVAVDYEEGEHDEMATETWFKYFLATWVAPSNIDLFLTFTFSGEEDAYLDEVVVNDEGCDPSSTACSPGGGGNPVPEPAGLLLFGTALVGLGVVRRKFAS